MACIQLQENSGKIKPDIRTRNQYFVRVYCQNLAVTCSSINMQLTDACAVSIDTQTVLLDCIPPDIRKRSTLLASYDQLWEKNTRKS